VTKPRIRSFSFHYREKYGQAIGKIPIDLGLICPNRAQGGCIYCRPTSFTPGYLCKSDDIAEQIVKGKNSLLKGRFRKYFAYFQQETSTAAPVSSLLDIFKKTLEDKDCVGLIISTRPDYVDEELLAPLADLIRETGRECLVEIGTQTIHDASLQFLNRNHDFNDFKKSAKRIKSFGCFELGVHLIFGIPGESEEEMLESLTTVCQLGVDALKLHHLQVIKDTPLADLYKLGKVPVFTKHQYLAFLLKAIPLIPAEVTIHRLWATSHLSLLEAPRWNVLANKLSDELRALLEENKLWQGCAT
jgi:radical SAM protein (TIGR01212 family)